MYAADETLKALYRADSINKNMIAEFRWSGEDDPFLTISDNTKFSDMSMEESLSSDENLEFGSCEATELKLTVTGITSTIKNSEMTLYQTLDGLFPEETLYPSEELYPAGYTMPFGKYVVQSAERQENSEYWDIKALDFMSKFDTNVIDWYNALTFPMTLRAFRASLCAYVGVTEEVPDYLPNDDMLVDKTIDTEELIGRNVLIACEQANGAFGHFDRSGVLQHVVLQPNDRLVPSLDLYPSEELYPVEPGEMNTQIYDEQLDPYLLISCSFEEYTVKSIDKIQIRQEEGDIGALYGEGTNCYTVEGNFLMYGKTAEELGQIAQNIYGMISGRMYIPFESESKGLPYIEVGDAARFEFGEEFIVSYVIKRTLKGIYALRDSYGATGDEIRSVQNNINTEIIQLKGKAAILTKNVDEVSAKVIDLAKNTETQFKITAEQIESTVKRIGDAESQIKQTADQISMKVGKGDVSAQLSIESGGITLKGNRISWESTNSSLTADGTLNCKNGIFSGQITASKGKIAGFEIDGDSLSAVDSQNASIDFGNVVIDNTGLMAGNWWFSDEEISCMDYIIANSNGNVFVYNSSYYKGWAIGKALDDLRNRIGSGGGCGSDCDDTCYDAGCNDDALIDDIGGC